MLGGAQISYLRDATWQAFSPEKLTIVGIESQPLQEGGRSFLQLPPRLPQAAPEGEFWINLKNLHGRLDTRHQIVVWWLDDVRPYIQCSSRQTDVLGSKINLGISMFTQRNVGCFGEQVSENNTKVAYGAESEFAGCLLVQAKECEASGLH